LWEVAARYADESDADYALGFHEYSTRLQPLEPREFLAQIGKQRPGERAADDVPVARSTAAADILTAQRGQQVTDVQHSPRPQAAGDASPSGIQSGHDGLGVQAACPLVQQVSEASDGSGQRSAAIPVQGADVALSTIDIDLELLPPREPKVDDLGKLRFSEEFDRTTLIYDLCSDVDGTRAHVFAPAPVATEEGALALEFIDPATGAASDSTCWPGDDKLEFFEYTIPQIPAGGRILVRCENQSVERPVQPNLSAWFAGRRVLFTMSKNNRLDWILDWLKYHVHHFGIDGGLVYDNASTYYASEDLRRALEGIDGIRAAAVIDWPFAIGSEYPAQPAKVGYWAQPAFYEHARRRFLAQAEWALNLDVDELLVQAGPRSLSDYIAELPAHQSWIAFNRFDVPNRRVEDTGVPRHGQFWWRATQPHAQKYLAFPKNGADGTKWWIHRVHNDWHKVDCPSSDFYVAHMLAITTGWQGRTKRLATREGPSGHAFLEDLGLRDRLRIIDEPLHAGGGWAGQGDGVATSGEKGAVDGEAGAEPLEAGGAIQLVGGAAPPERRQGGAVSATESTNVSARDAISGKVTQDRNAPAGRVFEEESDVGGSTQRGGPVGKSADSPKTPLRSCLVPRQVTRELPKVLHTVWVGGEPTFDVTASPGAFLALNPGWEHRHWDNEAVREFPEVVEALERWPDKPVIAANLARMLVVGRYGGLYADLDYAWQEPMTALDLVPLPWVSQEWHPDGALSLTNAIFAGMSGDSALQALIERAGALLEATGTKAPPNRFGVPFWSQWADSPLWCVLPPELFNPILFRKDDELARAARGARQAGAVAVHLYTATWTSFAAARAARVAGDDTFLGRRGVAVER